MPIYIYVHVIDCIIDSKLLQVIMLLELLLFTQLLVDSSLCSLGSGIAESQFSPNSTFNTSSVCLTLKQFLNNGANPTGLNWRELLDLADTTFSYLSEYIKVVFIVPYSFSFIFHYSNSLYILLSQIL